MNEMVERVARAMCDGKWDAKTFAETANGEDPEEQRDYWREKARAAIEAMREPTEEMVRAGWRVDTSDIWTDMIDAALEDDSERKEGE